MKWSLIKTFFGVSFTSGTYHPTDTTPFSNTKIRQSNFFSKKLNDQAKKFLNPLQYQEQNNKLKIMIFNRNSLNVSFQQSVIEAVWQKGIAVAGYDPNTWRKDTCDAWMKRSEHGNTNSEYGWEVDHIKPKAKYGSDDLSNLQPLQWENNRHKGDNYPNWTCKIKG